MNKETESLSVKFSGGGLSDRIAFDKKFGFGAMRPPMLEDNVDIDQVTKMVDAFMGSGFNYFDTSHVYLDGKSEDMLKKCLTSRYPRNSYILTNKLTVTTFKNEGGVKPIIKTELKACGVDYFDFLLMHAQTSANYEKFRRCRAYEQAFELKEEGVVKHVGISFHDQPEVLERILDDYPGIEVVQLQFNYLDLYSPSVRSIDCYEICARRSIPVIVMEPLKGGHLASLPPRAMEIAASVGCSPAELAIRYVAGYDNIVMVLSGMSSLAQLEENISFMKDFKPLSDDELEAVNQIRSIIESMNIVQCTDCRYCVNSCPKKILIPGLFSSLNEFNLYHDNHAKFYYNNVLTVNHGLASECIKCGSCEKMCPQHLPIRTLLEDVASVFENRKGDKT